MQEIVRDVPKEYKNIMSELVKTKQFNKIPTVINELKYKMNQILFCTQLEKTNDKEGKNKVIEEFQKQGCIRLSKLIEEGVVSPDDTFFPW